MDTRFVRIFAFVVVFLPAFISHRATADKLIQVQLVHRHGARHSLSKHPTDPRKEEPSGTLYTSGIEQMKQLGVFVRKTYINSDQPISNLSRNYNDRTNIASFSSNLPRTQMSARAFLSELYPEKDYYIPTLVFHAINLDWIIRGYALCNSLASRSEQFRATEKFKQKEQQYGNFIARLAKTLGDPPEKQNLQHVFNVYDRYTIINNDLDDADRYKRIAKIPDADMSKLKKIADWYESNKYAYAAQNINVAAGLLEKISGYAAVPDANQVFYHLIEYSAHYPTILTLLASMRASQSGNLMFPADAIPEFGAALIFEMYENEKSKVRSLRLKWYSADNGKAELKPIQMGFAGCTDKNVACPLSVFSSIANKVKGVESFCRDCETTGGICATSRASTKGNLSIGTRILYTTVSAGLGIIVGLLCAYMILLLSRRQKRRTLEMHARSVSIGSNFEGEVHA